MKIRDDINDLIDGRLSWTDLVARLGYNAHEEVLFRSHLRRAGIRAREHIADARAARRAEELAETAIAIDCGTETLDKTLDRPGATTEEQRSTLTAQITAAAERVADEIVEEVRRTAARIVAGIETLDEALARLGAETDDERWQTKRQILAAMHAIADEKIDLLRRD